MRDGEGKRVTKLQKGSSEKSYNPILRLYFEKNPSKITFKEDNTEKTP